MNSKALEESRASLSKPEAPRHIKFRELAWGALVYANSYKGKQGTRIYDSLVGDGAFLKRLQKKPSLDDFEKLRNFLVHFGVPQAPKTLPQQQLHAWPLLKPHIKVLHNERLETCDLSDSKMQEAIKGAFRCLRWPFVWGSDTVPSKVLHFFNVYLFVMWDSDIRSEYTELPEAEGYLEFLRKIQTQAKEVIREFKELSLPGSPESFLSQRLGYPITRPLTRFLDMYNWMTITEKWPSSPPDWLLRLF